MLLPTGTFSMWRNAFLAPKEQTADQGGGGLELSVWRAMLTGTLCVWRNTLDPPHHHHHHQSQKKQGMRALRDSPFFRAFSKITLV
jgi:hypothetical protein